MKLMTPSLPSTPSFLYIRVARNGVKKDPIKGLYTCGNCLGNRYGLEYVTPMASNSIGMAQTHGWLAGKNAAKGV